MKILIVEDEEILSRVLKEKLIEEKFDTEVIMDGALAVEATKKFKPDLILLDLVLPNKDGFDILTDLKEDNTLKDIPVIVLSNLGQDTDIKRALKLGAVDYMVKTQHPINEIVEEINYYLLKAK